MRTLLILDYQNVTVKRLVKECVLTYMATLSELMESGALRRILLKSDGHSNFNQRAIFSTPEFYVWLHGPVMTAAPFYSQDIRPRMQALDLLKRFLGGKPFDEPRLFKRMSPASNDVWEFSTKDLRFFGWFHVRDCFIAVRGDFFGSLKADPSLYELHRIASVDQRTDLDLDEPKYLKDGKYRDVISD